MLPHILHYPPDRYGDERLMGVLHKDLLALRFADLLLVFVGDRCFLHVECVPDVGIL